LGPIPNPHPQSPIIYNILIILKFELNIYLFFLFI